MGQQARVWVTLKLVMLENDFARDGFVVLRDVFAPEEIGRISDEIDRIVEGRADYIPERDIVYEPGSEPRRVRNAFRLHVYHPAFLDLARHPELVDAMSRLLPGPIRLYGSQLFAKPARVGTEVPLHQDMPYWPFAPYELISAWIALDNSTIENGCVRYVAGSHKLGMMPHAPSGVPGNSLGLVADSRVRALPEVPVEVQRGSCILHHCLTAHRSEPNQSDQPRRGLIYVYMSRNVQLVDPSRLKGPADFPEITAAAER
jgi:ectoine hydroxylase-related dioxygenase (phytanoyl-CoA dioxygenase family)